MENLFIEATRKGLLFPINKGTGYVSDLWRLTKTQLNEVYTKLQEEVKPSRGLLQESSEEDDYLQLSLKIVKFIFDEKCKEDKEKEEKLAEQRKNKKIKDIIAAKRDQALLDMSIEELEKLL